MIYRDFTHKGTLRSTRSRLMGVIVCLVFSLISVSCSRLQEQAGTKVDYPQPGYPRYLVNPNMDELLSAARFAVRQTAGMAPLGNVQSGQTVYVLMQWGQDMKVWEAMKQAWAEKGVEARTLNDWEVIGITQEEYQERMSNHAVYGNEAWKELGHFRGGVQEVFPGRNPATIW